LEIDLSNNGLTGQIPSLSFNGNVYYIDLSDNNLTGQIPSFRVSSGPLEEDAFLDLSNNNLCGNIPEYLMSSYENITIFLENNYLNTDNLSPEFAEFLDSKAPNWRKQKGAGKCPLTKTDCEQAREAGEPGSWDCEGLISFYENTNGDNWKNNSGWNVTDIPCSWYGITECGSYNLLSVDLSNNGLVGQIPSLDVFWHVYHIDLSDNNLMGRIPELSVHSHSFYEPGFLDLSNNKLCGDIPPITFADEDSTINLENNYLNTDNLDNSDPEFAALLDLKAPGWRNQKKTDECPLSSYWTDWLDRDNPTGNGDGEWISAFEEDGVIICPPSFSIAGIEARRISDKLDANLTGENFISYDSRLGFSCENKDQPDNQCFDYEVRFTCVSDKLSITLVSLKAISTRNDVRISWITDSELDNAGFHIWRAIGEGWKKGDYSQTERLTKQLIPSMGNGVGKRLYHYIDSSVEPGVTYHYGLEDINTSGERTIHWNFIAKVAIK
jgi:hypothetical protein